MTYQVNDMVGIDMGEGEEPIILQILEVHEDYYTTLECSDDYEDIHGELYDDDDNHYLISKAH